MARTGNHDADFTAYYQKTRDLRSGLVELAGDILVHRPVNLGTRMSRGGSLLVRGPLARGLRYIATVDLVRATIVDGNLGGFDDAGTRYGGSFQLIYRDGIEGRAGADKIRLVARYSGPSDLGLTKSSSSLFGEASWAHAITDRLSAVLTAYNYLRSPKAVYFGEDVISRSHSRPHGPIVKLALTYGLGSVEP